MIHDDGLAIWTVYDSPRDYPGEFVARMWRIEKGEALATTLLLRATSLDDIRALLPCGLSRLCRQPDDDPCIVEVWF